MCLNSRCLNDGLWSWFQVPSGCFWRSALLSGFSCRDAVGPLSLHQGDPQTKERAPGVTYWRTEGRSSSPLVSWAFYWTSLLSASLSSLCRLSLWESTNGALSNLAFWAATRLRATRRCRILTTMTERPFSARWIYCLLEDIQMLKLWQWCCKNNWMPSIKRSGQSIHCDHCTLWRLGLILNCLPRDWEEVLLSNGFNVCYVIHHYSNVRTLYFLNISPQRSPRENEQGELQRGSRLTLAAYLL